MVSCDQSLLLGTCETSSWGRDSKTTWCMVKLVVVCRSRFCRTLIDNPRRWKGFTIQMGNVINQDSTWAQSILDWLITSPKVNWIYIGFSSASRPPALDPERSSNSRPARWQRLPDVPWHWWREERRGSRFDFETAMVNSVAGSTKSKDTVYVCMSKCIIIFH